MRTRVSSRVHAMRRVIAASGGGATVACGTRPRVTVDVDGGVGVEVPGTLADEAQRAGLARLGVAHDHLEPRGLELVRGLYET
jgi:hypothetical protein